MYEKRNGPTINAGPFVVYISRSITTVTDYHGIKKTFYWEQGYAGTFDISYSDSIFNNKFAIQFYLNDHPVSITSVTIKVSGYIKYTTNSGTDGSGSEVTPITEDRWTNESVTVYSWNGGFLLGKVVTHDWYQTIDNFSAWLVDDEVTIDGKKYKIILNQ